MNMRRILTLIMISFALFQFAGADEVDVETAKTVAKYFLYEKSSGEIKPNKIVFENINLLKGEENEPILYVMNMNQGFIVMSADDRAFPVLSYSYEGNIDVNLSTIPDNYKYWLNTYQEQISFLIKNSIEPNEKTKNAWIKYMQIPQITKEIQEVTPLLEIEGINWDQGCYYNTLCPEDNTVTPDLCGHAPTGCAATAMAQIMRFHKSPEQGLGQHSYTSDYGDLSANFAQTYYDWDNMPGTLDAENSNIATVLYHCGVSIDMDYGPDGSGAYSSDVRDALVIYFDYHTEAEHIGKDTIPEAEWKTMLTGNLNNSWPVFYGGQDPNGGGGHAFVCDGYEGEDHFHFNWGWGGMSNSYNYLDELIPTDAGTGGGAGNYTSDQEAIFHIHPESPTSITANFSANPNPAGVNTDVQFTDETEAGTPTSWEWTFEAGEPATSTVQNPVVSYPAAGLYGVTLTVSDGTDQNTRTKPQYVEISNTWPVPDFSAENTIVIQGDSVLFTDLSQNNPTTWEWTFETGAPATFSGQTPPKIKYDSIGVFDVSLTVTNEEGTATETKEDYITVIPPSTIVPTANFTANYTSIMEGSSVNFTDLSNGDPIYYEWTFTGAETTSSTERNPAGITYMTAGEYDVKLKVTNTLGVDSITKTAYIHVLDSIGTDAPLANFTSTNRLIAPNNAVSFIDLSENNPMNWSWEFEGGVPASSTDQNPVNIMYSSEGIYQVKLTVSNQNGADIMTKSDYVMVTSSGVNEQCDFIDNIDINGFTNEQTEMISNPQGEWGYFPGHNGHRIRAYADRFDEYFYSEISKIKIPISKAYCADEYNPSYIDFTIWDGLTQPENQLYTKRIYINEMTENFYTMIEFDEPIEVEAPFYVGFKLSTSTSDRFATEMVRSRTAHPDNNTLYVQKSGTWYTASEYFGYYTSLAIEPHACLVGVEQLNTETKMIIYPNPARDIVNIEIDNPDYKQELNIMVYDLTGKQHQLRIIKQNDYNYQLDVSPLSEGVYFVNIQTSNKVLSSKITIIR